MDTLRLTIFDAGRRADWQEGLARFAPNDDVYFSPGYHAASAGPGGGEPYCALIEDRAHALLLPYLRCPIPESRDCSMSNPLTATAARWCSMRTPRSLPQLGRRSSISGAASPSWRRFYAVIRWSKTTPSLRQLGGYPKIGKPSPSICAKASRRPSPARPQPSIGVMPHARSGWASSRRNCRMSPAHSMNFKRCTPTRWSGAVPGNSIFSRQLLRKTFRRIGRAAFYV